jgi:signal transduction histidine kinase
LAAEKIAQAAVLAIVEDQLRSAPREDRQQLVARLAARTGVDVELFQQQDISGNETLTRLAQGDASFMNATDGRVWMLKRLADDDSVLAYRYALPDARRGLLEWVLALIFYAAIALVIMFWLWPLTRDLRQLERSTLSFGNRNWVFDPGIKPRSQIYPLAEAFRRMAARIDDLIGSHQDMSNAVSHEIKTPLSRMRFELEMARMETTPGKLAEHLNHIDTDIAELNAFVTATLDYAILERAEVALNLAEHNFTLILPAVTDSVRRSAPSAMKIRCEVDRNATHVWCDAHLIETVLKNLLYNAIRFAQQEIRVAFEIQASGAYSLSVDDDGPGIPDGDRQRVFDSFVRLGGEPSGTKGSYGLGLAIVKRIVEWHRGEVSVIRSELGGARFSIRWPSP